jgi:hypothetical protein
MRQVARSGRKPCSHSRLSGMASLRRMDGDWGRTGTAEMTEHWRSAVPDLSTDSTLDRTSVDNDWARVIAVRQRYLLELKHVGQTDRSRGHVLTRLTRVSDWTPLTDQEQLTGRASSPYALCRGVASGLRADAANRSADDALASRC